MLIFGLIIMAIGIGLLLRPDLLWRINAAREIRKTGLSLLLGGLALVVLQFFKP